MEFNIRPARPEDAPFIAWAIAEALHDHFSEMAGGEDRVPLALSVFTDLAAGEDAQYSYRNTLIAETATPTEGIPVGTPAGALISYDGAMLHPMREAFIRMANERLGYNITADDMEDETSPDEIYLDTLAVRPQFRGHGLGARLIEAAAARYASCSKPLGLLCDYDNPGPRRLYISLGFRPVGTRPFAGIPMEHLRRGQ